MCLTWPSPRKKQKRNNRNIFSLQNHWQTCQWYFVLTIWNENIKKTFVSLGRPARPRLDHGARKGKGDDYQEVDVNGKRLSHKNTRRSLQKLVSLGYKKKQTKWPIKLWTLKQEMDGNGNWWRPCKHERKVLIGLEHTLHSLEGTSGVLCCLQHQFFFLVNLS